jgi:hypothetical protein
MNNQLDPPARAKDTLLDLAVRFGPKLLVAIPQMEVRLIGSDAQMQGASRGIS